MKNILYAGILSMLGAGCASQTTFLEYPISVGKAKATYVQQSDGDCYLKAPVEDEEGYRELRVYDQRCDSIADSAAEVSRQERFYSFENRFKDRNEMEPETQQYLDFLLQTAALDVSKKEKNIPLRHNTNHRFPHDLLF